MTIAREELVVVPIQVHPPIKVSEALGEIVWLMSQSPLHKGFFISDLEWMIMTLVQLGQFRLFHGPAASGSNGPARQQPVGAVFWAFVSSDVEARLAAGQTRLRPQDWESGVSPIAGKVPVVAKPIWTSLSRRLIFRVSFENHELPGGGMGGNWEPLLGDPTHVGDAQPLFAVQVR